MEKTLSPPLSPEHFHVWVQHSANLDWCATYGCNETRQRKASAPQTVEMPRVETRGGHKDEGKPMVQHVDPRFLFAVGNVMAFGAKKYDVNNWRKGIEHMRLAGSVLRHMCSWIMRENLDPESGLPHLAHAGASLMMLYTTTITHPNLDDRP